jgi:hypothetical protein
MAIARFTYRAGEQQLLGDVVLPNSRRTGIEQFCIRAGRLRPEAYLSPIASAEVKNTWIYMSIPQYVFMGQLYLFTYVLLGNVSG